MSRSSNILVQAAIFIGLMIISGTSHAVTCTVDTEDNLRQAMEDVTNGINTSKNCPDPNTSYDNYSYFEMTQNIELTQPLSIPAYVHLKGKGVGILKTITSNFGAKGCVISLDGEFDSLENIYINVNTEDTAICMKAKTGAVTGVHISSKGDGIHVDGDPSVIDSSFVDAAKIGILAGGKDPTIRNSTISGRLGLGFSTPTNIPIGKAANLFLRNNVVKNTDTHSEDNPNSFKTVYGQSLNSLPQCGVCVDAAGTKKNIMYEDNGTCQPAPDGCTKLLEGIKMYNAGTPMYMSSGSQMGYVGKLPSDLQVYYAAPTGITTATVDNDATLSKQDATTVEDKNAATHNQDTTPPPQWDSKSLSNIKPYVTNGQEMGGGCSLNPTATTSHELNTILALLLCAMVAARACHSSKS